MEKNAANIKCTQREGQILYLEDKTLDQLLYVQIIKRRIKVCP